MADFGTYHFLPWLRRGIGAALAPAAGPLPARAQLKIVLGIDATLNGIVTPVTLPGTTVSVTGPGDIIGVSQFHVIRTEPRHNTPNFEPNYLAHLEFDTPDAPWLFTPAGATGDRLQPWLALIVLKSGEYSEPATPTPPVPSIGIISIKALQNLDENWSFAHVQVSANTPIPDLLQNDPGHAISRLLCPRRLDPETSYNAFLVPAFDNGRKVGLGLDVSAETNSLPAWTSATPASASAPYPMPYYYRFQFHTSDEGDFESLVRRLTPVDLPPEVGQRPVAVDQPGLNFPSAGPPLEFQGALIRVGTQPSPWIDPAKTTFQTQLQSFLNLTTPKVDDPSKPDPTIVPPIYGRWHAGIDTVDRTHLGWLDDLNLDPRWRTPSGFGTEVIQTKRTSLLASAWQQVAGVIAANRLLRQAQLARAAMMRLHVTQLEPALATTLLRWTAPVQARISASPKTVRSLIRASPIPVRMLSGAFRRMTRPLGPLRRRQGAPANSAGTLLSGVNDGTLEIVPPAKPPAGTVSIDQVSDGLLPSFLRGLPFPPWLLLLIAILVVLIVVAIVALVAGIGVAVALLVAAAIALAAGCATIQNDLARILAGETLRIGGLTPTSLAGISPKPGFVVTPPGQPPQSTGATSGPDSPDAAAFRQAASDFAGVLQAQQPLDPVYPPLDIPAMQTTLLARLHPSNTIPARTLAMIVISRITWNPPDPITPIMAAPVFPQPMYVPLRDLSQQYILPGVDLIPPNCTGLLQTNHAFVEAYMVGLNHEMARQLLVNAYPTDQRGSYFRQFWDVSAYVRQPGDPTDPVALAKLLEDIPPIHTWPRNSRLGDNRSRKDIVESNLVLVIRGELLKRYPNTIIFAGKALLDPETNELHLDETDGAEQSYKHPIFGPVTLAPDITGFGFNLTADEALGNDPSAPHGYFFGFQQVPTEPRFGLEPIEDPAGVHYWSELSWQNFATASRSVAAAPTRSLPTFVGGYSASRLQSTVFRFALEQFTLPDFIPATTQPTGYSIGPGTNDANTADKDIHWGNDSAQAAYILLRRPFRIMVHATRMVTHV
ncbi:hypothetical protein [Paraburkholderia strydomiana]|uniref:Uncharacterized protein n=1 Tax=Paraburkholderia strydomiana TaxID=1245417 RepID=A0ABW9BZ49_9BURK